MDRNAARTELSVVLPTLNEAENLRLLIPEIEGVLFPLFPTLEILVIDDGSNDGTDRVAEEMIRVYGNVSLIRRAGSRSLSASWLEGFDRARGKFIGCMDADLVHNPADLAAMVEALGGCDMVIGSRYLPGEIRSIAGKPLLNRLASKVGGQSAGRLLGLPYRDVSHGFRVFRESLYRAVRPALKCEGNALMIEFLVHAHRSGYCVREIPVSYRRRLHGRSKLRLLQESLRVLGTVVRLGGKEVSNMRVQ